MDELGPLIYRNYEDCLLYYSRKELLASQASCNLCGAQMDLKRRPGLKDDFSCRCTNGNCRTWLTIRHGSFFEKSKLDLQKWLHIFYMWSIDASQKQIIETVGVSQKSIIDCCSFLWDICSWKLLKDPIILGGPGCTVQIDESLFKHKPKVLLICINPLFQCLCVFCVLITEPQRKVSPNRTVGIWHR